MHRLVLPALAAVMLASPAPAARVSGQDQKTPAVVKATKPAISTKPWPDDEAIAAIRTEAQNRRLFQDEPVLEFTLASQFNLINKERTPNNGKQFPGVLTVDGTEIPVVLGSRGHLRLKPQTCEFVPIKIDFQSKPVAGTVFDGQTSLKLGTHCRTEPDYDQYVLREYLAYKLANLVTPLSFRARLARATYVDARSNKAQSTHYALFLEHENDVARRLGGREARLEHMMFTEFDADALTTTMLLEYMLGNIDYSIWALHNIVIVQDKRRRFYPIAYDFDLSGMVHPPYAAPDPRLPGMRTATDRLYRGPCRTVEEFNAVAEPFRARRAEMFAAIDGMAALQRLHKSEMKSYLESFFARIETPQAIKRTFVDGCPANRGRV